MLARHWEKKRSWVDGPVIAAGRELRRKQADTFDHDAVLLAAGDHYAWDIMFQETAALLEETGYYFAHQGAEAAKVGDLVLRAEVEALRQRACRLCGDYPRTHDPLFRDVPLSRSLLMGAPARLEDDRDLLFRLTDWLALLGREMRPRQVQQYEADLRQFAQALKVVGNVRRQRLQKFYETKLNSLAPNTVHKKVFGHQKLLELSQVARPRLTRVETFRGPPSTPQEGENETSNLDADTGWQSLARGESKIGRTAGASS